MEMKMVTGVTLIVLIIYLAIREYFYFSSQLSSSNIIPQHDVEDQHQSSSSIFQIFVYAKPNDLVIFFTFNILVVTLLFGISSSRLSSSPFSSTFSISSFMDSYEGLKRVLKNEDQEDGFIPAEVYPENYEEKEEYEKAQGQNCNTTFSNCYSMISDGIITEEVYYGPYGYGHKDEFTPGMVHMEYYEEEKVEFQSNGESWCQKDDHHEDKEKGFFNNDHHGDKEKGFFNNDDDDGKKDEILICDESGYDEEGLIIRIFDEEDSYSELDDSDLNKRIEEFIDENNKKWREELRNEGLLELD